MINSITATTTATITPILELLSSDEAESVGESKHVVTMIVAAQLQVSIAVIVVVVALAVVVVVTVTILVVNCKGLDDLLGLVEDEDEDKSNELQEVVMGVAVLAVVVALQVVAAMDVYTTKT